MVIKCVIDGRPDHSRYVENINRNNPDFIVRPHNCSRNGVNAPVVWAPTSKTGDLRMSALRHFVEIAHEDDHLLMIDDDDHIEVNGGSFKDGCSYHCPCVEVDAVWCWLIGVQDAYAILEQCEGSLGCCEAEDLIILSTLHARQHHNVSGVLQITRDCVENLTRTSRRFSVQNFRDFVHEFYKYNASAPADLFASYVKIPLLSGVAEGVTERLSGPEFLRYLHLFNHLTNWSPELHNFILNVLRNSDVKLIVPFEDFEGYHVLYGGERNCWTPTPITIIKIFSPGYERFKAFHEINEFMFRLRNPRTSNVKFIKVWNGPGHPEGYDVYSNTSLADCRRIVLEDIADDELVQWVDGDDQVDAESIVKTACKGEQLVQCCCHTSAGNRTPVLCYDVQSSPIPRWDGNNPHWTALQYAKTFKRIQKNVDTLVRQQTADMPYKVERGCFYNEDVFHAMFRKPLPYQGSECVIYRFSAGSTNCKREFSFDRWVNLFGAGLWTVAKMGAPDVATKHFQYSVNAESFGDDIGKVMEFQRALHERVPDFKVVDLNHDITKFNKPYEIIDLSAYAVNENQVYYHWTW